MKKLLILAFAPLLVACSNTPTQIPESNPIINPSNKTVKVSLLGESCAEQFCDSGLACDTTKTCIDPVVDKKLVCTKDHKPVCGQKGNNKNGYLNECEAKRHGAIVVSEGFCEVNEKVAGNCYARILSIGNCREDFTRFRFDGEECVSETLPGCDIEAPFETKELCESSCK